MKASTGQMISRAHLVHKVPTRQVLLQASLLRRLCKPAAHPLVLFVANPMSTVTRRVLSRVMPSARVQLAQLPAVQVPL